MGEKLHGLPTDRNFVQMPVPTLGAMIVPRRRRGPNGSVYLTHALGPGNLPQPLMKIASFLALTALLILPAHAQLPVTTSGSCVSLIFATARGAFRDVIWTTYSRSARLPLGKRLPEGRLHSLEFRPRSGQPGVYEADYIVVSSDSVIEFGSITLNLPTEDGDTNGIPDLLQFNRGVDAAISGHVEPDYVRNSRVTRENFTGTLRRDAEQFDGSYTFALFADGESITEPFRILSYDGTATYQRGTINTLTRSIVPHREEAEPLTSVVRFRVVSPDKLLIPAQWGTINGERVRRQRAVLTRVGNRYVFTPNNRDGDSKTPWKDYVQWIEQIVDPN